MTVYHLCGQRLSEKIRISNMLGWDVRYYAKKALVVNCPNCGGAVTTKTTRLANPTSEEIHDSHRHL
jgi:hypothetical protein